MGWEQRGANKYYYRKERHDSRVKLCTLGGRIAQMVSQIQSSSPLLETLARTSGKESDKADAVLEQASELIQLFTEAALLTAGFHTHNRQWRRRRNVAKC